MKEKEKNLTSFIYYLPSNLFTQKHTTGQGRTKQLEVFFFIELLGLSLWLPQSAKIQSRCLFRPLNQRNKETQLIILCPITFKVFYYVLQWIEPDSLIYLRLYSIWLFSFTSRINFHDFLQIYLSLGIIVTGSNNNRKVMACHSSTLTGLCECMSPNIYVNQWSTEK